MVAAAAVSASEIIIVVSLAVGEVALVFCSANENAAVQVKNSSSAVKKISEGESNLNITAGKKFKDHFIRHKGLLEEVTGKKYTKYKTHGQEFLDDIGKIINDGTVKYEGMGTIKKGFPADKIYRGNGVTVILKQNNEFRTIIKSGEGMDLAIQMIK